MPSSFIDDYAATMRAHIRSSKSQLEQQAAKTAARDAKQWRERLTPLDARLAPILSEIPPEIQAEGLSLHTLQKFVKGRWRGCAHPGELGAALRRMGWSRTRLWRGDGIGFRALWLPPQTPPKKEQQQVEPAK
jgi:hypothetical protein